ncbi:MAG TPA: hypothetical protein VE783_04730, partial [Candidatus Limnocylindrales bacterium]|nr:hypothetical protein [Candidatus Limnocylindrales bacterium]
MGSAYFLPWYAPALVTPLTSSTAAINYRHGLGKREGAAPARQPGFPSRTAMPNVPHSLGVAYFSMEIALDPGLPTYSGGLGILGGDTLRSAADMGLPMCGVSLLHRKGYFDQHLDSIGNQTETSSSWRPEEHLQEMPGRAAIEIEGERVLIRAWQYLVRGCNGQTIPVFLLDTALPENSAFAQSLTDELYGGDEHYRLCQEVILGLGGIAVLRQLGHHRVLTYHMNEGHAALLALALLQEHLGGRSCNEATEADI